MRVTTAFNKMLSIPSATVASVEFTPDGVIVGLRRRNGRPVCPCGWKGSPRARHSRDFEDTVAWLAQRTDKTTITRLLRTSWETVAGIVERVVAEQIDERRLTGLVRIGVATRSATARATGT